ncbi:ABC transporter ATP-binding protein [Serinibacter arcticus]|uniref:ABC transporter ATP-binding protein n=1 Tax=Serinibacter arcticus TaxID=1655435 RepID=A0A2U1ZTU7_9MICO|nr:ABC transporter ATP-binding protein [Serinibacter arcticus]PWD50408.1 ABC transporter ATP-binding protein [Serinibacter arcticus]
MSTTTPAGPLVRAMFRRHWRPITVGYLLRILHQVCEALVPVAFGLVIGRAVATGEVAEILLGVAGILGLFAVLAVAGGYGYFFTGRTAVTEAHRLRVAAVRRVLSDPSAVRDRQAGELLSITSSDTRASTDVVSVLGALVAAIVGLGVAGGVLLRIDVTLGLGLLGAVVVLVALTQLLGPYLERRLSARQQAVGLAAAVAADLFAGLRSLRGFGGVAEGVRRYRGASRTSLSAAVAATSSTAVVTGVSAIATGTLVVLTAVVAARYAVAGVISVADLVTVIGMASFLMDPLSHITISVRDLAVTRASGRRVAELLGPDGREEGRAERRSGRASRRAGRGAGPTGGTVAAAAVPPGAAVLEVAGAWEDGVDPVALRLVAGEMLGVVTVEVATADRFAAVVSGEAAPVHGRATLDGADLATLPDDARLTGLLGEPHAVQLLGGTLAAALATGGPGRGGVDVDAALAAAAVRLEDLAGHDADAGPDGIALLDRGANLSGGQRQRVALARALHADRQVLVLRDPTSAVDPVTEDEIADGVSTLRSAGQTIVVTTSPLWLSRCDRVLFVDADGASTVGTHAALVDVPAYREAVLR